MQVLSLNASKLFQTAQAAEVQKWLYCHIGPIVLSRLSRAASTEWRRAPNSHYTCNRGSYYSRIETRGSCTS